MSRPVHHPLPARVDAAQAPDRARRPQTATPTWPPPTPTRHRLGTGVHASTSRPDPNHTVPHSGGVAATVVVTMTVETLMGGLQAAGLCDGTRISAGEARRLACGAGIIPVVLGGRVRAPRRRPTTPFPHQGGCGSRWASATAAAPPSVVTGHPRLSHAHHDQPWGTGWSDTNLKTGRLLCPRHPLAHDAATR